MGAEYAEQSNCTIAHQLQGKLLIAHGDLDDNVPMPAR
jgi:dipeptidyl aminopeptidase/acylaminoacyl peptidase